MITTTSQTDTMYDITLLRSDPRVSANMSACVHIPMKLLTCFGSRTSIPSRTVDTLAYGMLNRVRGCCLVARFGTFKENDCNKSEEQTLPVKMFLKNMISW